MKKLFFFVSILLQGCFWGTSYIAPSTVCIFDGSKQELVVPEKTTLNIYWDIGEAQLLGYGLQVREPDENTNVVVDAIMRTSADSLPFSDFCPNDKHQIILGERIFNSIEGGLLNAECLYEMSSRSKNNSKMIAAFFSQAIHRRWVLTSVVNNKFHVYYIGDKVQIVQDSNFVHRKLNDEEKDFVCAELFSYPNSLCSENAYEFVFPLDASVYSITVQNNLGWGYKPLKLDPSILPLESPGYKKLREYEESLANRK